MIQWGNGTVSIGNLESLYMMSMCEILIPLTTGTTLAALQERLAMLHRQFIGAATF
jgi:hypothetical protein